MENAKMMDKRVSLKSAIALMLIAVLMSTTIVYVLAVSPSSTFTISPGMYPGAPSFTVWKEGSSYFAKNANGEIDYSGTSATTLIQSVFNEKPNSVFFKAATYDLAGSTVTAYSPIVIQGEGGTTIISGGTLKIQGGGWEENINVVKNMRFSSAGNIVQLWYNEVIHGVIDANSFWKTSYSAGVPQLLLTDSATTRVRNNWFDGYNMQILKINGSAPVVPPLHVITDNDFGSTSAPFPSYSNPWDVAAIYISGSTNWGVNILNNLGYLNSKNIFVYSEAYKTIIKFNQIGGAYGNYVIDLQGDQNKVVGNYISMTDDAKGGIAIRTTNNLEEVKYANLIDGNYIEGANSEAAIYGVMQRSVISNNIINAYRGITLNNSAYNIISNNFIQRLGANANYGYREVGESDYNIITATHTRLTYIFRGIGGNTHITACFNNTVWIEHG